MKSENRLVGVGILSAFSASLCCLTPVLALLAGTSGLATAFSWLDPFRPYLVGLTVLILGFAWFRVLNPASASGKCELDCSSETQSKIPFIQSHLFLGLVTLTAILLLTFPHYAHVFFPKSETPISISESSFTKIIEFKIEGMTCSGCEAPIKNEIFRQSGVQLATVSYLDGNAVITYDSTHTDSERLASAISKIGYTVTGKKEIK